MQPSTFDSSVWLTLHCTWYWTAHEGSSEKESLYLHSHAWKDLLRSDIHNTGTFKCIIRMEGRHAKKCLCEIPWFSHKPDISYHGRIACFSKSALIPIMRRISPFPSRETNKCVSNSSPPHWLPDVQSYRTHSSRMVGPWSCTMFSIDLSTRSRSHATFSVTSSKESIQCKHNMEQYFHPPKGASCTESATLVTPRQIAWMVTFWAHHWRFCIHCGLQLSLGITYNNDHHREHICASMSSHSIHLTESVKLRPLACMPFSFIRWF